ncbi:MAG: dTMP kinase, partial [Chloroflexota bacterium]
YGDSSVAYQGFGRGLGRELVEALNATATGGLMPDLTLLLDLPPEVGLSRARSLEQGDSATKTRDAIGAEALAFHQRVRNGFLEIAKGEPERIVIIDASRPLAEVTEAAWERLRPVEQLN